MGPPTEAIEETMSDFTRMQAHIEEQRRWRAECENAGARLELAQIKARLAEVLSQHQPVADLKLDRDDLRVVIDYVRTGRKQ